MIDFQDYKKYKWFYTFSGKLVVGGRNSAQNDALLKKVKSTKKDVLIMHTSSPGSPFTVILSTPKEISKKDIEECAIFTACFSKAWKSGNKKALVDIFSSSQVYKAKGMNQGTWGVAGQVKEISVNLSLVLAKQNSVLRAIPEISVKNKKEILLRIIPGKIQKEDLLPKLAVELDNHFSQSEILSALPAGGISISKK